MQHEKPSLSAHTEPVPQPVAPAGHSQELPAIQWNDLGQSHHATTEHGAKLIACWNPPTPRSPGRWYWAVYNAKGQLKAGTMYATQPPPQSLEEAKELCEQYINL